MTTDTPTLPSYQDSLQDLLDQLEGMLPADKLAVFHRDATQLGTRYPSPLKRGLGDRAPGFTLPNVAGREIRLADLLSQGPVVLTFYRGVWCPYCNLELKLYQQILPDIREASAQLVAVSPMTPDSSQQMKESNDLAFEVLSDVGGKVAGQYTTVFENPRSSVDAMAELGYDFFSFYADDTAALPVPATFVIARDGHIVYAGSAGGDYRQRVEPADILDALRHI
ncbi:MAG TPA: AhpC/TSA family protein [Gammaproteobacteria bacterium]|nr:AhpC/TSA family protein [Gammaproteobacteria bacterium]